MRFFNVRHHLCQWQANHLFDPVKYEANHRFVTGEITIAFSKFGTRRDGFLSIHMSGHLRLRLGEERVDAMNGCALDSWDVASILCFHLCIAEVVDIDLHELGRYISTDSDGCSSLCLERVRRKINVGVHQVLVDVSCRFCNGAEQGWALDLPKAPQSALAPPPFAGGHMQS